MIHVQRGVQLSQARAFCFELGFLREGFADFGIAQNEPEQASARPGRRPHRASDLFDHQVGYCFHELAAYRDRLLAWKETYAPKSHHDDFHPRFLEALTQLDQVEAQMDMLLTGTLSEKQEVIRDFLREQKKRMKEAMDMEPKTRTPIYRESLAYAREHGELESFRLRRGQWMPGRQ